MENPEKERLEFIRNRDGFEASVDFAKRGMELYRKTVLNSKGNMYKEGFIVRYLAFKRYYLENKK